MSRLRLSREKKRKIEWYGKRGMVADRDIFKDDKIPDEISLYGDIFKRIWDVYIPDDNLLVGYLYQRIDDKDWDIYVRKET